MHNTTPLADLAAAEAALSQALAAYNTALKRAGKGSAATLNALGKTVLKFSDDGSKKAVITWDDPDFGPQTREYTQTDC